MLHLLPHPERSHGPAPRGRRSMPWLLVLTLLLGLPASAGAGTSEALAAEGWVLASRSDDPIEGHTLYARPHAGSDYDEFRMEVSVAAKPEDVMAALEHNLLDASTFPSGYTRRVLKREAGLLVSHDVIHVPFLSDRDVVLRTEIRRQPQTGYLTMVWRDSRSEGPEPGPDVVRMPSSQGSWTLVPDGRGGTLAIYQAHVELGGTLPAAIVAGQMPKEIAQQAASLRRTMHELMVARR